MIIYIDCYKVDFFHLFHIWNGIMKVIYIKRKNIKDKISIIYNGIEKKRLN